MTNNIKDQCRQAILSIAEIYIDIQNKQCDPLISDIEFELKQLYPSMSPQQLADWSMEFINWEKLKDRKKIFDRLDSMYGGKK